jgi:hypothetical protein
MFLSGRRAFRRTALLATLPVAAVLGVAMIAPSTAAACPFEGVCTDSSGVYTLQVPPLTGLPYPYSEYVSCEWDVHVDFGDNTTEDFLFNGELGIIVNGKVEPSVSHTFPRYGKYLVRITLSNGRRTNGSTQVCPDVPKSATVYFQSPEEIKEEEARLKAEEEAKAKKQAEEKAAAEAKKQKEREEREARERAAEERFGTGYPGSEGSSGGGPAGSTYWLTCRGTIQVHGVGCPKARKVIGRARRKNLYGEGLHEILGFSCHLTGTRPAQISCRREKRRILAPL